MCAVCKNLGQGCAFLCLKRENDESNTHFRQIHNVDYYCVCFHDYVQDSGECSKIQRILQRQNWILFLKSKVDGSRRLNLS